MTAALTINEVAHLAEVPPRMVEKAIETGIMKPVKRRAMLSRAPTRMLDIDAVCYFVVVRHSKLLNATPVRERKVLMKAIRGMPDRGLKPLDLEPGLRLDLPKVAGTKLDFARAYMADKVRFLTSDPEIFGGIPIIKGTRIPVYAISGRLADGDTLDDLAEDYPEIPRAAFVAADVYARTHPERGRPVAAGRPWDASPAS
jgi:uncharacterized protein (DUF433 family)